MRPHRLTVRTLPSQGGNRGSILLGATKVRMYKRKIVNNRRMNKNAKKSKARKYQQGADSKIRINMLMIDQSPIILNTPLKFFSLMSGSTVTS